MNAQVETLGPCKKQLAITVPPEKVKELIEESFVQLEKTVDSSIDTNPLVTGFRKGHIPRRLLEKRFGEQILEDVREQLIQNALGEACEENSLEPLGEPDLSEVPEKLEPDKPFFFKATVEVRPQFDINGYKGIEVRKPSIEVSDEEIDSYMERLREQNSSLEDIEEASQPEDVVDAAVSVVANGNEVWSRPRALAILRGHGIAGLPIEGFSDLMRGVKAGDQRQAAITLPNDFELEDWRGKQTDVVIRVSSVRRPVMPEINEEWAKSMHFESLDVLRNLVRREVARRKEQEAREEMLDQIEQRLLEMVEFEQPESAVKALSEEQMLRGRIRLMEAGTPEDKMEEELAKLQPASDEAAARRVKLLFIIDEIGRKEKIFATEEDVNRVVQAMARQYRRRPIEIVEQLGQKGMSELRHNIRENKIRELLLREAKIVEGAASESPGSHEQSAESNFSTDSQTQSQPAPESGQEK